MGRWVRDVLLVAVCAVFVATSGGWQRTWFVACLAATLVGIVARRVRGWRVRRRAAR